jgi:tRNA(fMet)-specific endonuclease VapC
MTHLLDTNACIVHLRSPQSGPIYDRLSKLRKTDVALCSVVASELLYGAIHGGSARDVIKVETFLKLFQSLPFDDAAARVHAQVREHLAK